MNPQASEAIPTLSRPIAPRRSPLRTLLYLAIFTGVLLIFIAWLGDWRRRHNIEVLIMSQVQAYSTLLTYSGTGLLPLNLQPSLPLDPQSRLIESWLTPDEARILRDAEHEVMVAWTVPLVRALGPNERAVIFFHRGTFELRWVPLKQFDELYARQVTKSKHLGL